MLCDMFFTSAQNEWLSKVNQMDEKKPLVLAIEQKMKKKNLSFFVRLFRHKKQCHYTHLCTIRLL